MARACYARLAGGAIEGGSHVNTTPFPRTPGASSGTPRPKVWFWLSTAIAAMWSLFIGALLIDLVLTL